MRRRIRELLDRLRDWWNGEPGRHTYPKRRPIPIVSLRLVSSQHGNDTELTEADEQLADALLRSLYPRLFWPADDYWRERYTDLFRWSAWHRADENTYRAAEGLAPVGLPPLPALAVA